MITHVLWLIIWTVTHLLALKSQIPKSITYVIYRFTYMPWQYTHRDTSSEADKSKNIYIHCYMQFTYMSRQHICCDTSLKKKRHSKKKNTGNQVAKLTSEKKLRPPLDRFEFVDFIFDVYQYMVRACVCVVCICVDVTEKRKSRVEYT